MEKRDNYTFLTQGPVHKVILTMAVPTIISMLITSLYNIADTFFVGQLDTQSIAAVGVSFSVMFFIQAVSFFFGNGSGNYISRELGARNIDSARTMASTGFFLALLCGLVITLAGLFTLEPLSVWLGSTPTILPYTKEYLSIIFLGAPFVTTSLCLNNQMRFQGNARFAAWGIVSGAVLNVLLDPLFIFVFDMGVAGAALATVMGQAISLAILLVMSHHGNTLSVNFRNVSLRSVYLREIFAGGTPSLSRQGLGCISVVLLNIAAGAYGDAAIAAMSIVSRITMFVFSVVVGLGQGFQPFCGFCYGAHLYDRLRHGYVFSVKVGTAFLVIIGVFGFIYSDTLVSVFRDDMEVETVGSLALRCQLITYPLCAFIMMSNMMMQTIRRTFYANLLAAARQGLFFIPLIIFLPFFFGLLGVEISQSVADILSFLLSVPIVWKVFRELRSKC